MSKKSKIIISIIGALLFVSIVVTGSLACYMLSENNRQILSSVYVKYENLPNIMQDDTVYIKKVFFEANEFDFVLKNEYYFNDDYLDEVELRGTRFSTNSYYLDLTRKNEDIIYYKFSLIRKEDSDKIPMEIDVSCSNSNSTIINAKKYGGCSYWYVDSSKYYIVIQANTGSKKCEFTLHIDVKQSYNFSQEELNSIYEEMIHSFIDNIIAYDEITARGGV